MKNEIPNVHHEMQVVSLRANGSVKIETINEEPSLTHQSFLQQSDINHIMRGYNYNQLPDPVPSYMDLSQTPKSLLDAHMIIEQAQTAFNKLPSAVRARFENDPTQVLAFLNDSKNKEEAISLGLIPPPPPPNPMTQIQNDLNEIKSNTKKTT